MVLPSHLPPSKLPPNVRTRGPLCKREKEGTLMTCLSLYHTLSFLIPRINVSMRNINLQ